MTQKDKELLLKEICARLAYYDLYVQYNNECWLAIGYGHGRIELMPNIFSSIAGPCPLIKDIKPYLRPMSSMTEEEAIEFESITDELLEHGTSEEIWNTVIDWLNAHHFDHRHLIEKGLALEASEGMYNIKKK
jgi:hypothetical protein